MIYSSAPISLSTIKPLAQILAEIYCTLVYGMCDECLFVCVDVLRPSQPNRVMSSVVSLPNHTFTGQA